MPTTTLPRGPYSALPQLAHMNDPFPYMRQLARDYADPMTCPMLGQGPMVLTWSPEGARAVFSAGPETFAPGTAEALAVIVGSGSIFLQSGERHRRTRKLLAPPFHGERMRAYGASMCATAMRWSERLPVGRSAPMLPIAQGITLDVIIEAIFGERDPTRVQALHAGILGVVAAFNPLVATVRVLQRDFGGVGPWARFRQRVDALHAVLRALIEAKRRAPGEDILSLLLSVRDEAGEGLSEQEIVEQLLTFVIAGHETTATSLAWALYELHRQPASLEALRAELDALGPEPAPEALSRAPYLAAVCDETLRLHPPLPIVPRRCLTDFTLGAYTLPAGTTIGVALYLAHLREESFPEPLVFRPDRFVGRTFTPFEYMPFGGGARRCLGASFARTELALVLGTLLSLGTFTLDEPRPLRNVFRIGTFGPEHGVRMTFTPMEKRHGRARSSG